MKFELRDAALEIEKYVSESGWNGSIRLFALVNAKEALHDNPLLAAELTEDDLHKIHQNPNTLLSFEQENLPPTNSVGDLLNHMAWPDKVAGAAISVERIVLPTSAEAALPKNLAKLKRAVEKHPERQDIRLVAAALRDGTTWAVGRLKEHDQDNLVLSDANLARELTQALLTTFHN